MRRSRRTTGPPARRSGPRTTRTTGPARLETRRAEPRPTPRADRCGRREIPPRARPRPHESRASVAARRQPPAARAPRPGSARAQPLRQRRLSRFGARRVEQLEHRRGTEEVEIARVRMAFKKPRAIAPRAGPAITQLDGSRVGLLRSSRPLHAVQQACVKYGERGEDEAREQGPRRRHHGAGEGEPQQDGAGARSQQIDRWTPGRACAPARQSALAAR